MVRLLWLLVLLSSIAGRTLQPAPDKLRPWTTALRDGQSDDALAAVYKTGPNRLVFVAARHTNRADSLTFRLINDAYAGFRFDSVIAEGFPTSEGANPASVFKYAAANGPNALGFVEGGETVPTVLGAERNKAALWGGEANDLDIKAQVIGEGVSPADLLGFYVLRTIPQWIDERRIQSSGDPHLKSLVVDALARNRVLLGLTPDVLPDFAAWSAWYRALNGKSIGDDFVTEEVGPLADGKFATNKIAYAVSRKRDAYLHNLIIAHLNAHETVLVVFGGSHFVIQRAALQAAIGQPCYVGTDLLQGASDCR